MIDYKKKYLDALERANSFQEKYGGDYAGYIFPELRESEDERIRKRLLWFLANYTGRWDYPETRMACRAWLEKQKDASYAIEAVDRIDKYIDEHLANAHDMKDSNPDKKYYRGWDDALGKMAGILQDVYSEEKKKESLRDFIDDFPYSCEQKEQKPAEWSEEDEKIITRLIGYFESFRIAGVATKWEGLDIQEVITLLKSLRNRPKSSDNWKPSEEQIYSLGTVVKGAGENSVGSVAYNLKELYEQLKRLKEDEQ